MQFHPSSPGSGKLGEKVILVDHNITIIIAALSNRIISLSEMH